MLHPWKKRTKQPTHSTEAFQRQFGRQRGCWCEQKATLYTQIPQQTYYAAVRVKGERLEARGRVLCCRGGGLASGCLSLIRRPAASDSHAHTHMLTFMRKHTLHINPLNLCPPKLHSLLPVFNKKLFTDFTNVIHRFFMQVLHVFSRSVLRSRFDI